MTGLGKLGQEQRRLVDEGLIKTIGHAQRREKALDAYALACVDAALADEWKLLDGPEFDYKKLTAEQEDLYAYAFNAGSKQAWEQAKAEHKSALADTLGMLEALANCDDGWMELKWNTPKGWVGIRIMTEPAKLQVRYYYNGWQNATRAEAEALLGEGQ